MSETRVVNALCFPRRRSTRVRVRGGRRGRFRPVAGHWCLMFVESTGLRAYYTAMALAAGSLERRQATRRPGIRLVVGCRERQRGQGQRADGNRPEAQFCERYSGQVANRNSQA